MDGIAGAWGCVGIMTELLKWAAGAREPESFHPQIESQHSVLALGPRSENPGLSVLDRSLRDHPVHSCHLTHRKIEAHQE